jgi:hypothetical protein
MPIVPDGPITDSPIKPDGPISDTPIKPDTPIASEPVSAPPIIKPDGPISDKPIVPDGPISNIAPNPIHTPHTFDAVINTVSKKVGVNSRIMQAIGMQESGLGSGGNYNPKTGRDKDGNQGVSPWQLDPASGIAKEKLDRAAKDPAYAAELSANLMKQNLAATGGNLREALSMYNSGSRTSSAGLAYADSVLHFMGNDDQILSSPSFVEKVKHDAATIGHALKHGQPITAKTMGHLQTTKPLHDLEVKGIQAWNEVRHNPVEATLNVIGATQRLIGGAMHESARLHEENKSGTPDLQTSIHQLNQAGHNIWDMVFNPTEKNQEKSTSGVGELVNSIAGKAVVPSHSQIDVFVRKNLHTSKVMQPYVDGILDLGEDLIEQTISGGPAGIGRGLMHIGLHAPAAVARAAHGVAESMGIAKHFPHLPMLAQAHEALANAFVARRDLDRAGLTEAGKKVRLAIENKHLNAHPNDIHVATRAANKEFEQLAREQPGRLHTGDPRVIRGLGVQDNSAMMRHMRGFEEHNPITKIAKLGKKAILLNPMPHGLVNVGTLTYQAGGLQAVLNGFKHMIAPTSGSKERLEAMGGLLDYVDPTNNKLFKAGNDLLHRMEVGWRSGLLEQLDKKLGPSAPGSVEEYLKGHLISNRVGDYRNQSAFVKMFQALGGPFVAFGLGIVPQQFVKTLKEDPHRIYTVLQSLADVQANRQGKRRNIISMSNPITEALKLFSDPVHYMTSSSRIGPLSNLFDLKEEEDEGKYKGLGERGLDLAAAYIPGAEILGKSYTDISGQNMPGQRMSLADKLADVIEEEMLNMFFQKDQKPKVIRAGKKKTAREVGF